MDYRDGPSAWIVLSRAATGCLVMSLIIIPRDPFSNLSDRLLASAWEAGDVVNQASYTLMGVLTLSMIPIGRFRQFLSGFTPLAIAAVAWLGLAALTPQNPDLSLRRLPFTLFVYLTAARGVFFPGGIRQPSAILDVFSGAVLLLFYALTVP